MQDVPNDIILKASQGDMGAFEVLYKNYFNFVANVAFRITGQLNNAEEVAQEVFMKIYDNLQNFRYESSLKTWIYRITMNCAINYSKKMSKENRTVEYKDIQSSRDGYDVDENINSEYHEKMIEKFLGVLNPDQRACIVLRSVEGLSYQEISEVLKIPINTVRTRIKRARETMLALRKEVIQNEL